MSIFVCGDIHAVLDIGKLRFLNNREDLTRDDYLIICGDTAICGFDVAIENETRSFLKNLPVTVLFCDGNHENFATLNDYPVQKWHGGDVHVIEESIIHLMRGQIYDIDGESFFVMGGACSTDKDYRDEGVSWFKEELPSKEECHEALLNLSRHGFEVDYIISHCAPYEVVAALGREVLDEELPFLRFLQEVSDRTNFTNWYFGHYHEDETIDEYFHCLIDEVIELN